MDTVSNAVWIRNTITKRFIKIGWILDTSDFGDKPLADIF